MNFKEQINQAKTAFLMMWDGGVGLLMIMFNTAKLLFAVYIKKQSQDEVELLDIDLFKRFADEIDSEYYDEDEYEEESDSEEETEDSDMEPEDSTIDAQASSVEEDDSEEGSLLPAASLSELDGTKPRSATLERIRKRKEEGGS